MSAALVESVREAIAAGHTRIGLWQEDDKDRVWLYLPAILAALTEGEALRAQVAESQAREAKLREALDEWYQAHENGNPAVDSNGEGVGVCIDFTRDFVEQTEELLNAPTDTAALRAMLRAAWIDASDDIYGSKSADAYVDRVLGGS